MPFLLDFTILMVLQKNVIQVIFAKAKPPIKPLVHPDPMPPTKDPLPALNAHPERMLTLSVPKPAKIVILIPTNRHPMRRHAFQCKQGITNRARPPKSNARRVKQEAVAARRAKIAWKEPFKPRQVKPPATTAPADGAIPATDRPVATPYHRGRTY